MVENAGQFQTHYSTLNLFSRSTTTSSTDIVPPPPYSSTGPPPFAFVVDNNDQSSLALPRLANTAPPAAVEPMPSTDSEPPLQESEAEAVGQTSSELHPPSFSPGLSGTENDLGNRPDSGNNSDARAALAHGTSDLN